MSDALAVGVAQPPLPPLPPEFIRALIGLTNDRFRQNSGSAATVCHCLHTVVIAATCDNVKNVQQSISTSVGRTATVTADADLLMAVGFVVNCSGDAPPVTTATALFAIIYRYQTTQFHTRSAASQQQETRSNNFNVYRDHYCRGEENNSV